MGVNAVLNGWTQTHPKEHEDPTGILPLVPEIPDGFVGVPGEPRGEREGRGQGWHSLLPSQSPFQHNFQLFSPPQQSKIELLFIPCILEGIFPFYSLSTQASSSTGRVFVAPRSCRWEEEQDK